MTSGNDIGLGLPRLVVCILNGWTKVKSSKIGFARSQSILESFVTIASSISGIMLANIMKLHNTSDGFAKSQAVWWSHIFHETIQLFNDIFEAWNSDISYMKKINSALPDEIYRRPCFGIGHVTDLIKCHNLLLDTLESNASNDIIKESNCHHEYLNIDSLFHISSSTSKKLQCCKIMLVKIILSLPLTAINSKYVEFKHRFTFVLSWILSCFEFDISFWNNNDILASFLQWLLESKELILQLLNEIEDENVEIFAKIMEMLHNVGAWNETHESSNVDKAKTMLKFLSAVSHSPMTGDENPRKRVKI